MLHKILKFQGDWRPYQEDVLNDLDKYLDDAKIHIVAAPGAGKTVLGIELIRRMGHNAVILVPRISILEQWKSTVTDLFQNEIEILELISTDIKKPAPITITTYQALGSLSHTKTHEYFKKINPKTILLDESHHLTEKWNTDARQLIEILKIEKTIALTATPPYEVNARGFDSYTNICGEIDVEISVPELVSYKNLCPHQDYVYINSPNDEDKKTIYKVCSQMVEALEVLE